MEDPRLVDGVLPESGVEDKPRFMGRAAHLFLADAPDFCQFVHQLSFGLEPPRRVDQYYIWPRDLAAQGVEDDSGGVAIWLRFNEVCVCFLGPFFRAAREMLPGKCRLRREARCGPRCGNGVRAWRWSSFCHCR